MIQVSWQGRAFHSGTHFVIVIIKQEGYVVAGDIRICNRLDSGIEEEG